MNEYVLPITHVLASPFANTCVIGAGDPYQLPPVGGAPLFAPTRVHQVNDLAPSRWDSFLFHELSKSMRQKDDASFADLLNNIRKGFPQGSGEIDTILRQRIVEVDALHPDYPKDVVHAYARNKFVWEMNEHMLHHLVGDLVECEAKDSHKDRHTQLFHIEMPTDPQKTGRLVKVLKLKKGARVMLTHNIDTCDGLTNGAMGTVDGIVWKSDKPEVIMVTFDHKKIGTEARKGSKFSQQYPNSVPIGQHQAVFYIKGRRTVEASRVQFPLQLCWAVTIHKLQGLTLKSIVVDMDPKKGKFGPGQAYVAFSRVRSLQGLHILNYDANQIKCDARVNTFMNTMQKKQIPIIEECLSNRGSCSVILTHQNVEGLKSHQKDVMQHTLLQESDIVCMTETHLKRGQEWPLKRMLETHIVYRSERSSLQNGGVAIAVRKTFHSDILSDSQGEDVLHVRLHFTDAPLDIVCMYRRPASSISSFCQNVANLLTAVSQKCFVVGDMNEDILSGNTQICNVFEERGFVQKVKQATTDYGTLLDHGYVRGVAVPQAAVFDCYYSYHDTCAFEISL